MTATSTATPITTSIATQTATSTATPIAAPVATLTATSTATPTAAPAATVTATSTTRLGKKFKLTFMDTAVVSRISSAEEVLEDFVLYMR